MANPYSKYTGSRISPVPANYLQSTAAMSENLRKGLTSIGEAIGGYLVAKDKKEQDILNQEAVEDWYDSEPTPYGYEYNEEGLLTRIEGAKELTPKEAYANSINTTKGRVREWLELYGGDKGKRKVSPEVTEKVMKNYQSIISKAEDKYSSGGTEVSALGEKVGVVNEIAEAMGWDAKETAKAKARIVGALPSDSSVPATLQSLEKLKELDWYKNATPELKAQFDQMAMGIFREQTALQEKSEFVDKVLEGAELSPEENRSIKLALVNINPDDKRSNAQIMLDELKQTEAWQGADEARRNAMTEQIFNVTKKQNDTEIKDSIISSLGEKYNLSKNEIKILRLRGLGVGEETSPQERVLAGLKQTSAWKNADPERQSEMEQQVYSVEPLNRDYQRDVTAGTAYINTLKEQGKIIEQMRKAKTLTAMKTIFQNMPDDSVLPSEVQTWNVIEKSLKEQGVDEKGINEYFKIHYGLEERRDEIPSVKQLNAYEAILADRNLTDEQKSRAGVAFGYVTKEEQLLDKYEKWENGDGKDAPDVEKQRKARALGIIGPLDTKEKLLDIKLKAARAKEDEKLAEAISKGEVDTLDIPGAPGYKFVRASADQGYQLINTNTRSIVRDVTAEEAREWNKKLKDAGFPHQWHKAPSKSGKTTYELINPTGDPFNVYMRGVLSGPSGGGTGGGGTGGVVPVPREKLSREEQAYKKGHTYVIGNSVYRITPNGGRVKISELDGKGGK